MTPLPNVLPDDFVETDNDSSNWADYKVIEVKVSHGPDVQSAEEPDPDDVASHDTVEARLLVKCLDEGGDGVGHMVHVMTISSHDEEVRMMAVLSNLVKLGIRLRHAQEIWHGRSRHCGPSD